MVRLCDELRPEVDWVLIDSPAGIERGFRNSVAPSDKVLIVTNPEMSAVRDADRVIGLLEAEEKAAPSLIINRLNPNMVRRGDMLSVDDVYDLLRIDVVGIVPEDESVIVASNKGTPLAMDGKSKAGQAFRNIARRLAGEQVPFLDLESHGLWERLTKLAGRK
jgi:septum site-determining protein MinD